MDDRRTTSASSSSSGAGAGTSRLNSGQGCPEDDAEHVEEYYASRAKIDRKFFDNRTGRRTRKRSGPGPPDPSKRVPFDPNSLDRSNNSEPEELYPPKPARMFSNYVFGGDPTPANPWYEEGSLLAELDRSCESNKSTERLTGKVLEDNKLRRGNPHPPTSQGIKLAPVMQPSNVTVAVAATVPKGKKYPDAICTSTIKSHPALERTMESTHSMDATSKSSLTRYTERKMEGRLNIEELLVSPKVMASDKSKMKVAAFLKCSSCHIACASPVYGCIGGHPMCSSCLPQAMVKSRNLRDKVGHFRCSECGIVNVRTEMKQVDQSLKEIKFVCYCGLKVSGTQLKAHQYCTKLKHNEEARRTLVCESYGASSCEFCSAEVIFAKYVDHLLKAHFKRSFPVIKNDQLMKMAKPEPLLHREFILPLAQTSQRMSVLSSSLTHTLAEFGYGKFTLHQVRVEEKQLVWCISFEPNTTTKSRCPVPLFQARLKFEATVKNRLYRKICNTLVYPIGKDMEEDIFLELVGRALPDVWTPCFKFAYTHKTTMNLEICRSDGRYVRRFGRTIEIIPDSEE